MSEDRFFMDGVVKVKDDCPGRLSDELPERKLARNGRLHIRYGDGSRINEALLNDMAVPPSAHSTDRACTLDIGVKNKD